MTKFTLLALLGFILYACSPSFRPVRVEEGKLMGVLPLRDGKVTYAFEGQAQGASDVEIFRQARRWVAFHIPDARSAFGYGDVATRDVIGMGMTEAYILKYGTGGTYITPKVGYTISVECNPGTYRVVITNLRVQKALGPTHLNDPLGFSYAIESGTHHPQYYAVKEHFKAIDKEINGMISSLEQFIAENVRRGAATSSR